MTSRRSLLTETWLVLGVSLGASAIWSFLRIIERLTDKRRSEAQKAWIKALPSGNPTR